MRKVLYILGQLNDEDIEWMMANGRYRVAPAKSVLIQEGQPVSTLFVTLDGAFSITAQALGGQEIARLGAGDIVGEMSFIDARPPSATVTALLDSAVLAIDKDSLQDKLNADAGFAARFYRAIAVFLSERLRQTVGRLGYGAGQELDESVEYEDELDPSVLDNIHLAGARFERLLSRLKQGA